LIIFEFSNAASKTETNIDNTNLETDNPDIINHQGNAEKWKWIRLKLSSAASWYFNWIESKITILKQLEFQLST
jgi:hypothetical protein